MAAKSPLERAARALCALAGNPENATMNGKPLWMDYLPEARAVIEAIREPNDRMLDAACEADDSRRPNPEAIIHWQAMIGALLAD